MRALIVEDETRLAEALEQILKQARYAVDSVGDGQAGLDCALTGIYDIIILDIMLPEMDGFDMVRALREARIRTPVLLLTAREEVADKIHGLDSGADDYMTKPFAPEELLARLRALTRRQEDTPVETLSFDDLTLNPATYTLQREAKSVRLSQKELEVLSLLMRNPSMHMPKETILARVWQDAPDAGENNVEAYISFLRKKLTYLGSRVGIASARMVGYRLEVAA